RSRRRAEAEEVLERLNQSDSQGPSATKISWLHRQLIQAGINLSHGQLLALSVLSLVFAFLILVLAGPVMLVFAVLVTVAMVFLLLRWRYYRRVEKMISQLPEFLDH